MRIGVPAERMEAEHRIALAPSGARELAALGHEVLVDAGAGSKSSDPT
jgi:alanine dehydrogenase